MPFQKGRAKSGGRAKGTINKLDMSVIEMLQRVDCNPFEGMAMIAGGHVPCGTCHGKGKTKYKVGGTDAPILERVCESCYGTLLEKVSPETRLKAYSDLGHYLKPKLSSMALSNPDGTLRPTWEVVIKNVPDPNRNTS